jgi:hypothetical protein
MTIASVSIGEGEDEREGGKPTYKLRLAAVAELYHPSIRLDKTLFTASHGLTTAHPDHTIVLKTQAPVLLGKSSNLKGAAAAAALTDACWRPLTLTNPLPLSVVFTVSIEGPFVIRAEGALSGSEVPPSPGALVGGVKSLQSMSAYGSPVVSPVKTKATHATPTRPNNPNPNPNPNPTSPMAIRPPTHTSGNGSGNPLTPVRSPITKPSLSLTRLFNLLPQQSASFSVAFLPHRDFRQSLKTTLSALGTGPGTDKPTEADGKLVVAFATGQTLIVPIHAHVATPFITASAPTVWFGVCHVSTATDGTFLLSNPTDVTAKWTVAHIPTPDSKRTAIQVAGYNERGPETDDPSVFDLTPSMGVIRGPTLSIPSAAGAPAEDINRAGDSVVGQRLSQTSWVGKSPIRGGGTGTGGTGVGGGGGAGTSTGVGLAGSSGVGVGTSTGFDGTSGMGKSKGGTKNLTINTAPAPTLTLQDTLAHRFEAAASSDTKSDALYPMPIQVAFRPRKNIRYSSRFRFTCEYGNSFDVVLQGEGTYEEHEHKPLHPFPR